MNSLLERIYETGRVEDSEGNGVNPLGTSVPYATGMLLYELIRERDVSKTLEIGMAYGLSTLFMCQAHRDKGAGHHTAIDPHQDNGWRSIGLLNVKRAGFEDIFRFFQACSFEVYPKLWEDGERFDLVFVDGAHRFDEVMLDFYYVDKLLNLGGYVVFDDLSLLAVRKVVSFVLRNRAYELVRASTTHELPLWKRVGRIGRHLFQSMYERDYSGFKLSAENVRVLRKTDYDTRSWDFHRSF